MWDGEMGPAKTQKPSAIRIASKVSSDEGTAPLTDADRITPPGSVCYENGAFFSC